MTNKEWLLANCVIKDSLPVMEDDMPKSYYLKSTDEWVSFEDGEVNSLVASLAIKYNLTQVTHTIGFSESEQKWYGWSHRAVFGFGIDSKIKKGDCAYQAANINDFMQAQLEFWGKCSAGYMTNEKVEVIYDKIKSKYTRVLVTADYTDTVPNESLRGTKYEHFSDVPESFGKGEWTAKTIEDAKQMAIDFAEGVS